MVNIINIGDIILITSERSKYFGYTGTVAREPLPWSQYKTVGIYPHGSDIYHPSRNKDERDKYLKLSINSVKKINENGEYNMSKITGFKKVAAIKQKYGTYYYALFDDDICVGDKVLVTGNASCIVHVIDDILTVEESKKFYDKDITAEVMCKIDMTKYEERQNKRVEAEKIKLAMDAEIKKMQETDKYEVYAVKNKELAKLLEEYKDLIK